MEISRVAYDADRGRRFSERPAILHFVTGVKPWKPSGLSVNATLMMRFEARPASQGRAATNSLMRLRPCGAA